jgi:hypothetical protein
VAVTASQLSYQPTCCSAEHEPTWRDAYDAAVTSGIEAYEVEVETKDDFGLDAKIAAEFFRCGFSIGGEFESHIYHASGPRSISVKANSIPLLERREKVAFC